MTANGYGVSFCSDENVLNLDCATSTQLCELMKTTEVYT